MAPTTVTVRREVLEVDIDGTASDGAALQRRLPGVCAHVLAPALEAALARVDPGDAVLVIERLAIDVASIALDRFDVELADAVHREVTDFLRRNPPVPPMRGGTRAVGDVQQCTAAESVDEALLTFLRTGRLPWSFRVPPGERLEAIVLATWRTADAELVPPTAVRAPLLEVLALPRARARLVMQFTRDFVTTVIRGLSPPLATTLDHVTRALAEIAPTRAGAAFARRAVDAVLVAASTHRQSDARGVARSAWANLSAVEREDRVLAAFLEHRWPGVTEPTSGRAIPDAVAVPPRETASSVVEIDEETGGILVDNAGIVILHPFLPRFFAGLGVASGDELLDPGRAVALLHHLATGELTAPEHELTIAKVLCGVSLEEPLDADPEFVDAETDEALALLDAAIGHWDVLRGTSPDALRGEFLMRAGTLAVDSDGDWLLRVETRTVDILLDQLPWGVSLIKLPWMDRLLRVEWR